MRKLFSSIIGLINKYTSGPPFMIWSAVGLAILIFTVLFRYRPEIQFDKLIYLFIVSPIWFIVSEIVKKKGIFNKKLHFIIDSIFYLATLSLFVYFTGGYKGGLFFVFLFGAITAPLFGTVFETFIFITALSVASFLIYFFSGNTHTLEFYSTSLIILQSIFYFAVAGIIEFSFEIIRGIEKEKRIILEKSKKELEEYGKTLEQKVKERIKDIETKSAELERMNKIMTGRELKVIELKKEIEELKKKVKEI